MLDARRRARTLRAWTRSVELRAGRVLVGTASDPIELLTVQPAGKRAMTAADWWRGRPPGSAGSRRERPSGRRAVTSARGSRPPKAPRTGPYRIQAARRVAYDVLRAVHGSDAYANLLLPAKLDEAGLTEADAGLATELTYGTLRCRATTTG